MAQIFRNSDIFFQSGFFIFFSLSLLLIPVHWIFGWFVAVFVHEFFHYIVLRICKVSVLQISIGAFGADIQTGEMTTGKEILAALAGPFGSFLLLFLFRTFPYVSLCALGQLLFNLLPVYPMDGGRVMRGICIWVWGQGRGIRLSNVISLFFLTLLCAAVLMVSLRYRLGLMPMLIAALIVVRTIKIPCKERKLIVQ